jgi:hypothetical protein
MMLEDDNSDTVSITVKFGIKEIKKLIKTFVGEGPNIYQKSAAIQKILDDITSESIETKYTKLSGVGLPKDMLALCKGKTMPFRLSVADTGKYKGTLISSSFFHRCRIRKGLENCNETRLLRLQENIKKAAEQSKKYHENSKTPQEKKVLQEIKIHGRQVQANSVSYINPSLPFLSAIPDGIMKSNKRIAYYPIEIKCTEDSSIDALLEKDTSGLLRDADGLYSLRKGHEWESQLFCQMIVLRVETGWLVVWCGDKGITVKVKASLAKLNRLAMNAEAAFMLWHGGLAAIGRKPSELLDVENKKIEDGKSEKESVIMAEGGNATGMSPVETDSGEE